jgi:hypothetical protein
MSIQKSTPGHNIAYDQIYKQQKLKKYALFQSFGKNSINRQIASRVCDDNDVQMVTSPSIIGFDSGELCQIDNPSHLIVLEKVELGTDDKNIKYANTRFSDRGKTICQKLNDNFRAQIDGISQIIVDYDAEPIGYMQVATNHFRQEVSFAIFYKPVFQFPFTQFPDDPIPLKFFKKEKTNVKFIFALKYSHESFPLKLFAREIYIKKDFERKMFSRKIKYKNYKNYSFFANEPG